jgi:hypothetical protein
MSEPGLTREKTLQGKNVAELFAWEELEWTSEGVVRRHSPATPSFTHSHTHTLASSLVKQPVYMSMATTSFRVHSVTRVLVRLFEGVVWPDLLYLFVSREGFLLDEGVSERVSEGVLKELTGYPVRVVYTGEGGIKLCECVRVCVCLYVSVYVHVYMVCECGSV